MSLLWMTLGTLAILLAGFVALLWWTGRIFLSSINGHATKVPRMS